MSTIEPLWKPDRERIEQSLIYHFMEFFSEQSSVEISDYQTLYRTSIARKEQFWSAVWDFCTVIGHKGNTVLRDGEQIEKACWFPEATLNFAENLLRSKNEAVALYSKIENTALNTTSFQELYDQVAAVSTWLRETGVKRGDRVAGYLPNTAETVVAMLATASIGAIWTSTSPDFGTNSVLERFGQTAPKVLFSVDGYYYNGKLIDIRDKVQQVASSLATLEHTVSIPLVGLKENNKIVSWLDITAGKTGQEIHFEPCQFNDPLYILYSSGTTGKPKCITHKVGGTLLQHLKEHQLHCDIRKGDRVFYFTTCGWMMWNWLVSVLASEASAVLYDGSPFYPDTEALWRYADQTEATLFGTSAKYLDTIKKKEVEPRKTCRLEALRTICSTGSVLAPESFDYVYSSIKQDVCLSSISGGTDIISCFVLGSPILPVYRGECQCRGLGMAVEVFDSDGNSLVNQKGELVCTAPFPSQPAFFWGDPSGEKYHRAYFATFDNVWHHGDYVSLTERGTMIIYGRSDATLNPGGVRIGTAEIYRHVEQLDEILESIVIGQDWQGDTRLVLFVVLRPPNQLNDELKERIKKTLRENCSPRHIPAKIVAVQEIPRTKSGKIVELAVRDVVHDQPVENISALANPEALEHFKDLAELQ